MWKISTIKIMSKLLSASSNVLLLLCCPLNAWTHHFFRAGENSKEKAILERSPGTVIDVLPSDTSLSSSALLCIRGWSQGTTVPRLLCSWPSHWFQPIGGASRRLLGGRKWEVLVFLPFSLLWAVSPAMAVHPRFQFLPDSLEIFWTPWHKFYFSD